MDENQLEEIFKIVNDVYEAHISHSEGISKLSLLDGISNAGDLIQNYKCMREGSQYTRTLTDQMTRFFLKKIYEEFGEKALDDALEAVKKHTEYYESERGTQIPYLHNILDSFKNEMPSKETSPIVIAGALLCENCKKELKKTDEICPNCGTKNSEYKANVNDVPEVKNIPKRTIYFFGCSIFVFLYNADIWLRKSMGKTK